MSPTFGLTDSGFNTTYAPLCVVGQALWERGDLDSLRDFDAIALQTRQHRPGEKLLDALVLILAGYPSLYLLNTTLRADPMLAACWHRTAFAEQSTVSRLLDACQDESLTALRQLSFAYWQRHSQLAQHDWRTRLVLDLDLTPLPASRRAEGSSKGYLGKKTLRGGNWHA